jgi:hypothetical protein
MVVLLSFQTRRAIVSGIVLMLALTFGSWLHVTTLRVNVSRVAATQIFTTVGALTGSTPTAALINLFVPRTCKDLEGLNGNTAYKIISIVR